MTNPTHEAQTIREMQQLAIAALDELLSLDLPELSWSLYKTTQTLTGWVVAEDLTAEALRDLIRPWAKVLKTHLSEYPNPKSGRTLVRAVGEFENISVTVVGHFNTEEAP